MINFIFLISEFQNFQIFKFKSEATVEKIVLIRLNYLKLKNRKSVLPTCRKYHLEHFIIWALRLEFNI